MKYTIKRIDEDLDFGCEERVADAPVMAVVTLVDVGDANEYTDIWKQERL